MALMKFREPNQVKWQGMRPGHNGEQVLASITTGLIVNVVPYTVAAGKIGYVTFLALSHYADVAAGFILGIHNAVPVEIVRLCTTSHILGNQAICWSNSFWPPIELASGYSVRAMQSANATMTIMVHGWEE